MQKVYYETCYNTLFMRIKCYKHTKDDAEGGNKHVRRKFKNEYIRKTRRTNEILIQ